MATKRFYYNLHGFSDLFVDLTDGSNPVLMYRVEGGDLNVLPTKGKDGEDGEDGKSCYVYWAWCEDPATGSGFSLTTPGKYISFIKSETPIASPAFGDFSIWGQQRGDDGDDGVSSYLYVAFASDSAGTGFSLTWAEGLNYRAEIISRTEIATPTLSDFASAVWVKFVGDDGGGNSYIFDSPLEAYTSSDGEHVKLFYTSEFILSDSTSLGLAVNTEKTKDRTYTGVDYVKERKHFTNGSWYRLWASGWLEQGGWDSQGTANRTISLPKEFSATDYCILTTYDGAETSTGGSHVAMVVGSSTTTTSFTVRCRYGANTTGNSTGIYNWYTCGWAAR